jgi:hypothetical protein
VRVPGRRTFFVAVIVVGVAAWGVGLAVYLGAIGNPGIARMRGVVSSIGPHDDGVEICIADPVDAGTTYGDRQFSNPECWTGVVDEPRPADGDCVVVQSQGHVSELVIEDSQGCTG